MTATPSSYRTPDAYAEGSSSSTDVAFRNFLWQTPFEFNNRFDIHAKRAILSQCYRFLWRHNSTLRQRYFFDNDKAFEDAINAQLQHHSKDRDLAVPSDAWHSNAVLPSGNLSHQRGRPCSHVFRKGEPVYRCRDCALDDTCVICSRCFHATNHNGHNVLFSVSPGSGGCCDCGDPEAWKVPLMCGIHTEQAEESEDGQINSADVPSSEVLQNIRSCISTVLDFILDTFTLAPDKIVLPKSSSEFIRETKDHQMYINSMGIQNLPRTFQGRDCNIDADSHRNTITLARATSPVVISSATDSTEELYACIAWNDESHSYSHVLECIMLATGYDWDHAKSIVDTIHSHGREVIAVSSNVEELRNIGAPLAAINLGISIRTLQDFFREQVCGLLVDWLRELANGRNRFFTTVQDGDTILRKMISEELCAEWEARLVPAWHSSAQTAASSPVDPEDAMETDEVAEKPALAEDIDMIDSSLHHHRSGPSTALSSPETHQSDIANISWDPLVMFTEYDQLRAEATKTDEALLALAKKSTARHAVGKMAVNTKYHTNSRHSDIQELKKKLRLDYLMLYDLKLWKEMRVSLRELFIGSLIADSESKKILGKRLARNYPRLAESFLLKDREPENSIILLTVQLLTVPTVADILVNHFEFFGLICSALTAFFMTDHLDLLLPSERARLPNRVNCESRAFRTRRYFNAFHDLRYIMNVDMIKPVLVQDPLNLDQFIRLISMFQCMNAQICQKDTHVEYESEIWVNAFNVTLQISKCCRHFTDCFAMLPRATRQEQILFAQTLMLAITHVLRFIDRWDGSKEDDIRQVPEDLSRQQPQQQRRNTQQPGVEGPRLHKHHTWTLYPPSKFRTVDYDVMSEPVSFHHPLHWLLAGLLEYAVHLDNDVLQEAGWMGGFTEAIMFYKMEIHGDNNATPPADIMSVLDYPIRTLVFSAQIRAGVWVRNGYGVRNQAHHYRDVSLRETTFDADVFLLQLAFVVTDPELVLATLMDRFDLVSWFSGQWEHTAYDHVQVIFLVEELLNLLIICLREHSHVTGASLRDKIRQEIIHGLCLGATTYSELTKRIPERLYESADFEPMLAELATFRPPTGINDAGLYELKPEHYAKVDPYFWHYTRNSREEAASILKTRWIKENPAKNPDEYFFRPQIQKITRGPFQYLGDLVHTRSFTQMIAFTLWNVRLSDNHKSDWSFDLALHLIQLALLDVNNHQAERRQIGQDDAVSGGFQQWICDAYFPFASNEHTQDLTLFDMLIIIRGDDKYKESHALLDWVFDQLESEGPLSTRNTVKQWRKGKAMRRVLPTSETEGGLTKEEQKKLEAKERQKRIMEQFVQAQQQFLEQNEGLYDDDDDGEDAEDDTYMQQNQTDNNTQSKESVSGGIERLYPYPEGTCIVCQEEVNDKSLPYGMLGLVQPSNILREVPSLDDLTSFTCISAEMGGLDREWDDEQVVPKGSNTIPGFPAHHHKTGLYASTCGHLMHTECFEVYCNSIDTRHASQLTRNQPENRARSEFLCPLCKSLGNMLLPVYWKGRREVFPGPIAHNDESTYRTYLSSHVQERIDKIKQTIGHSRASLSQRRRSSGATKLKEAFSMWVPSLRPTSSGSLSILGETVHQLPRSSVFLSSAMSFEAPPLTDEQNAGGNNADLLDRTLGPFDNDIMHSSSANHLPTVSKIYERIFEVLSAIYQSICSKETMRDMSTKVCNIDLLWGILGYTISGVEIAARGTALPTQPSEDVERTGTLFDQIPLHTRMLLRILCDTILAYSCIMCQRSPTNKHAASAGQTLTGIHLMALGRLRQVFVDVHVGDYAPMSHDHSMVFDNLPLMQDDPFMILSELTFHGIPFAKLSIHILLRVLFLAELCKTTISIVQDKLKRTPSDQKAAMDVEDSPLSLAEMQSVRQFVAFVMQHLGLTPEQEIIVMETIGVQTLCHVLRSFTLPFLRKALVLMIVRYGYIPRTKRSQGKSVESDSHAHEFNRLLELLWLPDLTEVVQLTTENKQLITGWCGQHVRESNRMAELTLDDDAPRQRIDHLSPLEKLIPIPLSLPTPFYLIPLPQQLDQLIDTSMERVCQKCGSVPSDPALCLLCGTFVCAQSFCCTEDEEGECNLHCAECGGEIGILLSVKRCVLILLYNGNGWFMNAPYLDAHGEVDQTLRRGKPQQLDPKRYAETRKLWLQHMIPIYVARQIEAHYDIGGWTTL